MWAQNELNLRPLSCQIQRATVRLYVGRLETGKDRSKAAGECRHKRLVLQPDFVMSLVRM
jgi:hypothetical protein